MRRATKVLDDGGAAVGRLATGSDGWPDVAACALPTVERPLRLAEFDDLFATSVRSSDRVAPTRLRLELVPEPAVAARTAELLVRETACCEFFTFTLAATHGRVTLDVAVPESQVSVLDALAKRAAAATRP